ncbi:MAG: hypothetical protein EHM34_00200 [Nitrosopumilales archaeon]|nr:MAG: hypothetical protein EHM34_00200 [Nitrosopumilales archaeon]
MPNKNYVKGRAFEYKIKKHYEKAGFVVFRMAGSHSPADLIAFPPIGHWFRGKELDYVPILIQCKATEAKTPEKEIAELKKLADKLSLKAVLVTKKKGKDIFIPLVYVKESD